MNFSQQIHYNCPYCGYVINGYDVEVPTMVRCPRVVKKEILIVPDDPSKPFRKIIKKIPLCGKIYMRMPLKKKK